MGASTLVSDGAVAALVLRLPSHSLRRLRPGKTGIGAHLSLTYGTVALVRSESGAFKGAVLDSELFRFCLDLFGVRF